MTRTHGRPRTNPSRQGATEERVAPSAVLRGPSGGVWRFVDGGPAGAPHYCQACKTFGHKTAWCYYVGLVAHVTLCENCTEETIA